MYYQDFESYMQEVLGYKGNMQNCPDEWNSDIYIMPSNDMQNCEKFYPSVYQIIYPVIQNVCINHNSEEMSEELMQRMLTEVNIQLQQKNISITMEQTQTISRGNDKKREERSNNNSLLQDLIKIWIIREFFMNRPPHRPTPPRPPMRPPFPGNPGGRPPIMPRQGPIY